jgi:hypothetical protein
MPPQNLNLAALLGNLTAAPPTGQLQALVELRKRLNAELDGLQEDLVRRSVGTPRVTWEQIANALGVSKSQAHRDYGHLRRRKT